MFLLFVAAVQLGLYFFCMSRHWQNLLIFDGAVVSGFLLIYKVYFRRDFSFLQLVKYCETKIQNYVFGKYKNISEEIKEHKEEMKQLEPLLNPAPQLPQRRIYHLIAPEDYQASRKFMEEKGLALMDHEKKEGAKVGVPVDNYIVFGEGAPVYYMIRSNVFMHLADRMLIEAKDKYPERFGTGDADDVIDALLLHYPYGEKSWYIDFLKDEQFCYIMQLNNGAFSDKILRIDLFRLFQKNKKGVNEFTGGLFHLLKHFSHGGTPLSTGSGENDIVHINKLLMDIAVAFFTHPHILKKKDHFEIKVPISDKHQFNIAIYFEENSKVYFIKTIHVEALGTI